MHSRSLLQDRVSPLRCCRYSSFFSCYAYKLSLSRSLSLSLMRPAAALVYLASVARVAAIQYGFPSVKSETSSFNLHVPSHRRQPRLRCRMPTDGSLGQFEKKLNFANLTSDLPPPFASTSAPL